MSAVACYGGEVSSPQVSDLGAPAASPEYYVDMDGEADWDLVNLNAADEQFAYISLKAKFTELQEACGRAEVVDRLSTMNVVDFALGRTSAPVAGDANCVDLLPRNADVSDLQLR